MKIKYFLCAGLVVGIVGAVMYTSQPKPKPAPHKIYTSPQPYDPDTFDIPLTTPPIMTRRNTRHINDITGSE